jgi:hypothetical protein|tara:strand:+ start:379 stop:627 length:249 start_codon:yes stop_codon:yes gene_type:complete
MESNKQEKENLMKMPGDFKQMSGGSWMSKHVGSAMQMNQAPTMNKGSMAYQKGETKPDYPDIDGDGDKKESMAQAAKDKKNK